MQMRSYAIFHNSADLFGAAYGIVAAQEFLRLQAIEVPWATRSHRGGPVRLKSGRPYRFKRLPLRRA